MHTKVVYQSAKALARIGCAVLRFNFRGTGASAGSFDGGDGERDDFRAALDFMHDEHGDIPLWVAGMSFGAWVALAVGVEDPRVSVLLGLSTPVAGTTSSLWLVATSRSSSSTGSETRSVR